MSSITPVRDARVRRSSRLLALTLVAGCGTDTTTETETADDGDEGADQDRRGPLAHRHVRGARRAREEHHRDGGRADQRRRRHQRPPVEVIIEDDATDEAKAVSGDDQAHRPGQGLAIIGATGTGQTMAMRGDVERAEIPQVSMAGGTAITDQFDPLVFQTPWSNMIVVPVQLNYLKKQGITKIGLISDTGGFGKDGAAVIEGRGAEVRHRDRRPSRRSTRRHRHVRPAHEDQELRAPRRS